MGNFNSVSVNGEWGIIKKVPKRAIYYEMIYDQTVLGVDYLDCSNQTLSRIDYKMKDSYGICLIYMVFIGYSLSFL
ncbi:MAG: hypothetical protein ACKPKO_31810 [Candidatus Fonsibacter sp.]